MRKKRQDENSRSVKDLIQMIMWGKMMECWHHIAIWMHKAKNIPWRRTLVPFVVTDNRTSFNENNFLYDIETVQMSLILSMRRRIFMQSLIAPRTFLLLLLVSFACWISIHISKFVSMPIHFRYVFWITVFFVHICDSDSSSFNICATVDWRNNITFHNESKCNLIDDISKCHIMVFPIFATSTMHVSFWQSVRIIHTFIWNFRKGDPHLNTYPI